MKSLPLFAAAAMLLVSGAAVASETKTPLDFLAYCQKHRNTEREASLYPDAQYPSAWRCMNGSVYVCELGASGRGCQKAGFSFSPAESVRNWCRENPDHDFVPGAYLPNAAINWKCRGKQPVIVGTSGLDEQGYVADAWEKIIPVLVPERSFAKKPADYDALLKNLTKEQPAGALGSQLTASDNDFLVNLIKQQLIPCWQVPAGARDAKELSVQVRASVNRDGTVRTASIVEQSRMSDPLIQAAAESARRTFFNPQCTPLKLPSDRYEAWQELVVNFDPRDLL